MNERYAKYKDKYRDYRIKNKEKIKRIQKDYRKNNSSKFRKTIYKCVNNVRFGGNRDAVLERDNWQCQECGINNIQHIILFGKGISIHHEDGLGRNSKNPNNSIDNLITLCLSCHQKKEMIKRRVSK